MLRYYQNRRPDQIFDPEAHLWFVVADGVLGLYVMKRTARFAPFRKGFLAYYAEVPVADVPEKIRRRAEQRHAASKRTKKEQ